MWRRPISAPPDRCQCPKENTSQKQLREFSRSLLLLGLKIPNNSNKTEIKNDLRPRRCSSSTGWSNVPAKIHTRQLYRTTSVDDVTRVIPQLNERESWNSLVLDRNLREILNRAIYEEWYDKSIEASKREKAKRLEKKGQEKNLGNYPRNLRLLGLRDTCDVEESLKCSNAQEGPSSRKSSRMKLQSTSLQDLTTNLPNLKDQSNLGALKLGKDERKILNLIIYDEWIKKKNREVKRREELRKLKEELKKNSKSKRMVSYLHSLRLLGIIIPDQYSRNSEYLRAARSEASLNWEHIPAKVQTRILRRSVSHCDLINRIPQLFDPQKIKSVQLDKFEVSLLIKAIYEEWYEKKEEIEGKISKKTCLKTGRKAWKIKARERMKREIKVMKSWLQQKKKQKQIEREKKAIFKLEEVTKGSKGEPITFKDWLDDVEERESGNHLRESLRIIREGSRKPWNYGSGLYQWI